MIYYIFRKSDEQIVDTITFNSQTDLNKYLNKHKSFFAMPANDLDGALEEFDELFDDGNYY